MKIAYFDCIAGISGDMALGAFLDAQFSIDELTATLSLLGLKGYTLKAEKVLRRGISGTKLSVHTEKTRKGRRFSDIETMIRESALSEKIKEHAIGMFTLLARAESEVHGVPVQDVHFHEIGALDSIVDIVGCAIAVHSLGIEEFYASEVPLGSGFAESMHGSIPIPAPATLALLKGKPVRQGVVPRECTTPTGAAILAHLCKGFGEMPSMTLKAIGYGAGSADFEIPNLLRLAIGDRSEGVAHEKVLVLETNIDDMNPEFCEYLTEKLFAQGALDVAAIPMMMKKFRPAFMIRIVAPPEKRDALLEVVFRETTTAGVRYHLMERSSLAREVVAVATEYGPVRVKIIRNGTMITASPEYEDCKRIAFEQDMPIKEIYEAAKAEARKLR